MKLFRVILPVCIALFPASAMAQDMDEFAINEFGLSYNQCLSRGAARASRSTIKDEEAFGFAKKDCAEQRAAIVAQANGNPAVSEALDLIDVRLSANFAEKTRALRARRVASLRLQ